MRQNTDELIAEGVAVHVIGRLHEAPVEIQRSIREAEERTRGGTRMALNIAFNYSGTHRDHRRPAVAAGGGDAGRGDRRGPMVGAHLYTAGQPDVDLLIRTGGEQRTSNFLLWQSAYAELVFSPVLWPDFTEADLDAALEEFASRHRRFGS